MSRKRSSLRILLRAVLLLVVIAVVAGASFALWFRGAANAALPQVDGEISTGVSSPVRVIRDGYGVPHINAANLDDLFFAQGFVTAQDRLWQMDMTRRYASGRMAEVLGGDWLRHDIQQRTLLMRSTAERAATELSERDRRFIEAYVRGVNAYIDQSRDRLPVEFRVLRYEPEPWTVVDSMLVGANMAQLLTFEAVQHALLRERVLATLGPGSIEAAELYPNASFRDIPPSGSDPARMFEEPDAETVEEYGPGEEEREQPKQRRRGRRARRRAAVDVPMIEVRPGSNNWVVSGARTETGKPLLANDMHLPHQVPGVWYEAHLTSGEYDVAGVTLPGLPFVISGHNRRIAWGFTNVGPAIQDVYVERFNDDGTYATPAGPQKAEVRREDIVVRRSTLLGGRRTVPVEITTTRHGPIVTPLVEGETRKLALRWTLYEPGGLAFPFFDVNSAKNWEEFRRAFSTFANPGQNVVYADVDGHIGYQATGRVPMRSGWTGALPVPGDVDAFEWTGYVPYEQLPSVLDPPSGVLATANGRIVPDEFPVTISNEWDAPYRTERIYRMLSRESKLTAGDMSELQVDVFSAFDHFLAQRLVYAVDRAPNASDRAKKAATMLREWNGRIDAESPAPTIASYARRELVRMLLEPKLGAVWKNYRWYMSPVWLENTLLRTSPNWLPPKYESYDALLASALEAAVKHEDAPRDLADWRWGDQWKVRIEHPLFGGVPWLSRWASVGERPQSGNGTTVKQVGRSFGPSQRFVADMADLDRSTLHVVAGQSGHVFSPHFLDQFSAWYEGKALPLPFSQTTVEQSKKYELSLVPASR